MPSGFRIASAYVDVTLNRDALPAELEGLARDLSASSDVIGEDAGKRIGEGIGRGVGDAPVAEPATRKGTEAGGRFGDAFSTRVGAALKSLPPADIQLDDEFAQAKLDFIREELKGLSSQRIGIDVSETDAIAKLTVLREQLDTLRTISPSIQVKADTAAAAAEIDRFLAATEVKAEAAGKAAGDNLSSGMASSARKASPLLVSAIAAGLIAGGPAVSAAGILLFGGLSAAAASQSAQVQSTFSGLKAHVLSDVQGIASQTSGQFVAMAGDIEAGFDRIEPSVRAALVGVAPELREVVNAFLDGANTAVPAFTRAIQQGQPVVQGLDALIRDLGSGVAGFMDQLTAHSGAEGAVLSDLGQIIQELLPMVGELLGEGAELAQTVLPPVDTGLHLVGDALHFVAPILPEVVAGFLAMKVVSTLSGPLGLLSAKLQTVAADSEGATLKLSGLGAQGVSKLSASLPALGLIVGEVAFAMEGAAQQSRDWAQAMLDGGNAAAQATAQMNTTWQMVKANTGAGNTSVWTAAWNSLKGAITGTGAVAGFAAVSVADTTQKMDEQTSSMSTLERAQQAVTTATNDYTRAEQLHGAGSDQARSAADKLSSANARLKGMQNDVKAATEGATTAQAANKEALQGISNTASAANTQIQLLKGALDALTGTATTEAEAEIAVTQATVAATTATQGHTGALVDSSGALTTATDRGAAAQQSLIQIAGASHNLIATMEQQGQSTDVVSAKNDQLRQNFINSAIQMGYNAGQAQNLANKYYGIPGQVATNIQAYDNASPVIQRIQNLIAGLHNKDIFITTYNSVVSSGPAGHAVQSNAVGGIMLPMAAGGVVAMAAGADIFEPNNPTVLIGDNRHVRESFIPQDDSRRSKAILSETASSMGYGLVPNSDGGTVGVSRPVNMYGDVVLSFPNVQTIADRELPRQLVMAMREGIRKLDAADR